MVRLHRRALLRAAPAVGLVVLLGAALLLPVGAGVAAGSVGDGIVAATTTVGLACGDGGTVALSVAASAEPAEVVDGGTVTVSWVLGLPADVTDAATTIQVSIPLPTETARVDDVAADGGAGVADARVAVDGARLVAEVLPVPDAGEATATVVASITLRAGLAPAEVAVAAPDALTVVDGDGTAQRCVAPASPLLRVVVVAATPTTTTPPSTTSTTVVDPPWPGTDPDRPPTPPATDPDPVGGGAPSAGAAPDPSGRVPVGSGARAGALDVDAARARLAATRADEAAAAARAEALDRRSAAIDRRLEGLAVDRELLEAKLRERAAALDAVLAAAYVAAVDAEVTPEVPAVGSLSLAAALDHAREDYVHALRREAELVGRIGEVATRRLDGRVALAGARAQASALRAEAADGRAELEGLRLGRSLVAAGFRFPVAGPHDFSDTWHAPRSGGRLHEGTDVFAAEGTPLEAVEAGVLVDVGTDPLGGTTLWLVGESGTQYYYAHLSAYAPGVTDGLVVEAGRTIGFVGHTGNARSTPSHLHFQVHPDGGEPIDAYPLLVAVDQATAAGGTG